LVCIALFDRLFPAPFNYPVEYFRAPHPASSYPSSRDSFLSNDYLLKAIAEVQGEAGDQAGAQQTLASARKAADLIQEPRQWARCSVGLVN
jgi:hypothetical protein